MPRVGRAAKADAARTQIKPPPAAQGNRVAEDAAVPTKRKSPRKKDPFKSHQAPVSGRGLFLSLIYPSHRIWLRFCPGRYGANRAFAKILRFDAEGVIEAGAVILPGNSRREFDQLGFAEAFAQSRKESVGHFNWASRHRIGVLENQPFQVREIQACMIAAESRDLLCGDAAVSANGRADINSKRTAHESCHPQFC